MNLPSASLACVFHSPGQPFELREIPIPALQRGTLLVAVQACTICGSDLHTYTGRRSARTPTILGHEMVGRLVWPDKVTDGAGETLRAGERLVWGLAAFCGRCFYCTSQLPQKCESLVKYGHQALSPEWPLSGGLAEYCMIVPGTYFLKVSEEIPDELAAPAACATATVAAAIARVGEVAGKTVLVMGAGMLGLMACAVLDAMGAGTVLAADAAVDRARAASRFGARQTLDARVPLEEFADAVREHTESRGADIVLELAGVNAAVARALRSTRIGGTCILVGSVFPQQPLPVLAEEIVRRMITVSGVYNYAPADLKQALAFLSGDAHRYPLLDLVGGSFSLHETQNAFELAGSPDAPYRVTVLPNARP
jgi:putative phosphonate catabolism associated alcohol dehydrogenase